MHAFSGQHTLIRSTTNCGATTFPHLTQITSKSSQIFKNKLQYFLVKANHLKSSYLNQCAVGQNYGFVSHIYKHKLDFTTDIIHTKINTPSDIVTIFDLIYIKIPIPRAEKNELNNNP